MSYLFLNDQFEIDYQWLIEQLDHEASTLDDFTRGNVFRFRNRYYKFSFSISFADYGEGWVAETFEEFDFSYIVSGEKHISWNKNIFVATGLTKHVNMCIRKPEHALLMKMVS